MNKGFLGDRMSKTSQPEPGSERDAIAEEIHKIIGWQLEGQPTKFRDAEQCVKDVDYELADWHLAKVHDLEAQLRPERAKAREGKDRNEHEALVEAETGLTEARARIAILERALGHVVFRNHSPSPEGCDGCREISALMNETATPGQEVKHG
jgi:hypothetical protein